MLVDIRVLAFLDWHTATGVIGINRATALETLALFNPAIALAIPACGHVWATRLMTGHPVDRQHLALIATNAHSLWFRHLPHRQSYADSHSQTDQR
jgi:hypothetical protein